MIKIGTRGSKLALWQANFLKYSLKQENLDSELIIISTKGDKIQTLSFDKIEGKGFFTKELEEALLKKEIDLAVHSMKDMTTEQIPGLCITAVSDREDPSDSLIIKKGSYDKNKTYGLKKGAIIGTSSARRKCQIHNYLLDVVLEDIRGNVPTRIKKLNSEGFDAIVLATAGLNRLQIDLSDYVHTKLITRDFVPAPAQGVLAYQTREADLDLRRQLLPLHNQETADLTNIERRLLAAFNGGCHLPMGAICKKDTMGNYHASAMFAQNWKDKPTYAHISQSTTSNLVERLFEQLNK